MAASSPEKFIRESPLTMGTGGLGLSARPIQRSAGWLIGLKTAPEGPVVKGTVDEVFRASMGVEDQAQTEKLVANTAAGVS